MLGGTAGVAALLTTADRFRDVVDQDVPLLTANEKILQRLTDAETAERGFLITGDEAFLTQYEPGKAAFAAAVAEAADMAPSRALRHLILEQSAVGQEWIEQFADPIIELRRRDAAAAVTMAKTGAGKQRFDRLRELNGTTEQAIRARLNGAASDARRATSSATLLLLSLIVVSLGGGLVTAVRATRRINTPLADLVRTLHRLRNGERSARVDVAGPAEIVTVGEAVNEMAAENERLALLQVRRLTTARTIRRVASSLHSNLLVDGVLRCAVLELGPLFGNVAVARSRASGDVEAAWSHDEEVAAWQGEQGRLPAGLRSLVEDLAPEEVLVLRDVAYDSALDDVSRIFLKQRGATSSILARLGTMGPISAILEVHSSGPCEWGELELSLFEGIVREVRIALSNAGAFEQQQRVLEKLRQLDRDKSDFMSNVSHELRTPLTSIIGYLELLADGDGGELTEDQQALTNIVTRNSQRLLELIEDLLTLSRIEAGTFTSERTTIDLGTVVDNVVASLRPHFQSRPLGLDVSVGDRLGTILGDPGQLERVVLNLLGNSVKFTPPGGHVEVRVHNLTDCVEILVADSGIGIPIEEQSRLFERFFRSSTARERAIQGTGLGLSITKSIVERHGGHISVESGDGIGTTFRVRLPFSSTLHTESVGHAVGSAS